MYCLCVYTNDVVYASLTPIPSIVPHLPWLGVSLKILSITCTTRMSLIHVIRLKRVFVEGDLTIQKWILLIALKKRRALLSVVDDASTMVGWLMFKWMLTLFQIYTSLNKNTTTYNNLVHNNETLFMYIIRPVWTKYNNLGTQQQLNPFRIHTLVWTKYNNLVHNNERSSNETHWTMLSYKWGISPFDHLTKGSPIAHLN